MDLAKLYKLINGKASTAKTTNNGSATNPADPIRMSGTNPYTLQSNPHKSDSLTEQAPSVYDYETTPGTISPHDYQYPTDFGWVVEQDPGARKQDIQNSHLSEGPRPGKIPYMFNKRYLGKLGRGIDGNPVGDTGFLLNLSGNPAGGLGDAQFIPHVSVLRPAGMARGALRTIDDGAMVPGVYVADPTRR